MKTHLTLRSGNAKTGPIPVSTSSADTCPESCPFRRVDQHGSGGCYAASGPLALHWQKVSSGERGLFWSQFLSEIAGLPEGQLWRHNQAGDLPGLGEQIDTVALSQLVSANKGKRGWTYTHKHSTGSNLDAIRNSNANGFTVNLSANNLQHADELADTNCGPVVVVLPSDQTTNTTTPGGRKVVICPAAIRDGITCASCGLCQRQRSSIIGFPAHGTSKRKASAIASN